MVDTSQMTSSLKPQETPPNSGRYAIKDAQIGIYSFAQNTQMPGANYEFDVFQFRDPMGKFPKAIDGTDKAVREWIKVDPRMEPILQQAAILAEDIIRNQKHCWFTLGFRDHHGTWISRAVAEVTADYLNSLGFRCSVFHAAGVK